MVPAMYLDGVILSRRLKALLSQGSTREDRLWHAQFEAMASELMPNVPCAPSKPYDPTPPGFWDSRGIRPQPYRR